MNEERQKDLEFLLESGAITTSEKNLRSKIDSLTRSLKNLSEKKLRLEFEIKRQTKALTRKREELKKISKRTSVKTKVVLESKNLDSETIQKGLLETQKIDSTLLRESSQILEQLQQN